MKKSYAPFLAFLFSAAASGLCGYQYADHLVGEDADYLGWKSKQKLNHTGKLFLLSQKEQLDAHQYTKAKKTLEHVSGGLETVITHSKPLLASGSTIAGGILGTVVFLGCTTRKRPDPI